MFIKICSGMVCCGMMLSFWIRGGECKWCCYEEIHTFFLLANVHKHSIETVIFPKPYKFCRRQERTGWYDAGGRGPETVLRIIAYHGQGIFRRITVRPNSCSSSLSEIHWLLIFRNMNVFTLVLQFADVAYYKLLWLWLEGKSRMQLLGHS